ncbi:MAG: cardiolipin synthase B, partial [Verrucomicrobiota bacterium]
MLETAPQEPTPHSAQEVRLRLERAMARPFVDGNALEILRNGDQIFPPMLEAIEDARENIELLTYIYWSGDIAERFARLLAEKAREGLEVRVLLDAIGSKAMPKVLLDRMANAGVDVRWFRPINHRFWNTDNRS